MWNGNTFLNLYKSNSDNPREPLLPKDTGINGDLSPREPKYKPKDLVCYKGLHYIFTHKILFLTIIAVGVAIASFVCLWFMAKSGFDHPDYHNQYCTNCCGQGFLMGFGYALGFMDMLWLVIFCVLIKERKLPQYTWILIGAIYIIIKNSGLIGLFYGLESDLSTCTESVKLVLPMFLIFGMLTTIAITIGIISLIVYMCIFAKNHLFFYTSIIAFLCSIGFGLYEGIEYMDYAKLNTHYYGLRLSLLIYTYLLFLLSDHVVVMFDPIFTNSKIYSKIKGDDKDLSTSQILYRLFGILFYGSAIKTGIVASLVLLYMKLEMSNELWYIAPVVCVMMITTILWLVRYILLGAWISMKWVFKQCCIIPCYVFVDKSKTVCVIDTEQA